MARQYSARIEVHGPGGLAFGIEVPIRPGWNPESPILDYDSTESGWARSIAAACVSSVQTYAKFAHDGREPGLAEVARMQEQAKRIIDSGEL